MKAKKRQRLDGSGENKPAAKKQRQSQSRIAMKPDQLPWKAMTMPERLDDWEGINGGVEEIDDVEVVRDEATGKVSFVVKASAVESQNGSGVDDAGDGSDGDDGDEWSGFETGSDESPPPKAEKGGPKSRSKQKDEPQTNGAHTTNGIPTNNNPTSALEVLTDERDHDGADTSAWNSLRLSPDTLAALSKLTFSEPTPIQTSAIPQILDGKDVIGKASTGSGKTLAFGIPILEQFLENRMSHRRQAEEKVPLALILSPTRELAHQLDKHLAALCSNVISGGPSIATLTGGLSVQKQQRLLKDADIIIGTPGRLWEIISLGQDVGKALRQIQFLVVDEADRLLSEGHFKEVEEILNSLDRVDDNDEEDEDANESKEQTASQTRQTLVFSATFDRSLQKKLATKTRPAANLLNNSESLAYLLSKLNFRHPPPAFIDVNPVHQLAPNLTESLVQCEATEKDLHLYTLLFERPAHRTLVFANSIDAVRRLTPMLQNLQVNALALHSEMAQKARLRSVERFSQDAKKGEGSVLVATDVAARGLDIANVQTVIHYHLPRAADTYVHRSGRTARAGQKGSSIIICSAKEAQGVRRLVASVHAQSATQSENDEAAKNKKKKDAYYIHTLDPPRRLLTQLKPRLTLAKRIADTTLAKQKHSKAHDTMRAAAEELGQEYDSEEFEAGGGKGKGMGRKKRERDAAQVSKAEVGAMRAELRGLLARRVNEGWSPKYITAGGVDVDALLREREEAGQV